MKLAIFLKKKLKTSISNLRGHMKITSYRTMWEKKGGGEKVKIQNSTSKKNLFFGILPFSPLAMLATWLPLKTLKKL
jgi:hypothetical protein